MFKASVEKTVLAEPQSEDVRILKRVPEQFIPSRTDLDYPFQATLIDLETMGLNHETDEIIELGLLSFRFNKTGDLGPWTHRYNGLQQPSTPIPEIITKITGISDADVAGQTIDWQHLVDHLASTDLILCHNAGFDRKFLEAQTPVFFQTLIRQKPFGCTLHDIDWPARGFESQKLDYLNFKLGYFYEGHRALNDCYATFNLLSQSQGAFAEIKENVKRHEFLVIALNAAFTKKDQLKQRGYRWSDGSDSLPKGWWCYVPSDQLDEERAWLDTQIYEQPGMAETLPHYRITAHKRYASLPRLLD